MPTSIAFCHRALLHFRRKKAIRLINGKLAGTTHFEKKRKLLNAIGHEIGEGTKIVGPIFLTATLKTGKDCWIGADFKATGNGVVEMGDRCDIAPEVSIATGGHEIGTHERRAGKGLNENITIGNGCWIGQRVLLAHGAKIPDGCVIAAGAVVIGHKDFEPDTLIGGVPAKTIKHYEDGERGE